MPSRISYFNKGLFLSNIKRYWLITFAFTLLLFLVVSSYLSAVTSTTYKYEGIYDGTYGGAFRSSYDIFIHANEVTLLLLGFFSLVTGLAMFSYMHFQKNTAMIHALPLRRETLFVTNYVSGLFIVGLPLIINGIILLAGEALSKVFIDINGTFLWLGVCLVIILLFYNFTVFAGMFTGHLAAQAIFFLIFNFLAIFLESIVQTVQSSFLFGFTTSDYILSAWSPLYYILTFFSGFAWGNGEFGILAGYLAAGLFFLISAFFLYRKRHMEVATDVISFPIVKPIFKYSVAFCSAALLGTLFAESLRLNDNVPGYVLSYLLGGFIGYFVSEMLLRKTFRVFKAYKGFLVFALVLVLLLLSVCLDFFGYENRIPSQDEVEIMYLAQYPDDIARLALSPEDYDPQRHGYYFRSYENNFEAPPKLTPEHIRDLRAQAGIIEDAEGIAKARQIHAYIVENKEMLKSQEQSYRDSRNFDDYHSFTLTFIYKLKDGRFVERRYFLKLFKDNDSLYPLLREYLSLPQILEKYCPILKDSAEDIQVIYLHLSSGRSFTVNDKEGFLKAYKQDILAQDPVSFFYGYSTGGNSVNFGISVQRIKDAALETRIQSDLPIDSSYKNTLAFLFENGALSPDNPP